MLQMGGRAGHAGVRLAFSLVIIPRKAFAMWLVADMRACVDAHLASNHLREGNESDVRAWNDAVGKKNNGKDATQQEVRKGEFGDPI